MGPVYDGKNIVLIEMKKVVFSMKNKQANLWFLAAIIL